MNRALCTFSSLVTVGLATLVGCGEKSFAEKLCDEEMLCDYEDGEYLERGECIDWYESLFADDPRSERDAAADACADETSCDYLSCIFDYMNDTACDGKPCEPPAPEQHMGCSDASCLACNNTTECAATETCQGSVCRKRCADDADCPFSHCYGSVCADMPGTPCDSSFDCFGSRCIDYDVNRSTVPSYCGGAFCTPFSTATPPCQPWQVCDGGSCLQR